MGGAKMKKNVRDIKIKYQSVNSIDTIITGGNIITMDMLQPIAETVAIKDGKIFTVGSKNMLNTISTKDTQIIDLEGRTMLPGFIESHTHFALWGSSLEGVNGRVEQNQTLDVVLKRLRDKAEETPYGKWIEGFGYDDSLFKENRHFNRYDLDKVSTNHPIIMRHFTSHFIVANSKALQIAGITKETDDPEGGKIERYENGELTGLLIELSAMNLVLKYLPKPSIMDIRRWMQNADQHYSRNGVTSVHEAALGFCSGFDDFTGYMETVQNEEVKTRILAYLYHPYWQKLINEDTEYEGGFSPWSGDDKFRIGGVKLFQDGSIPGLTAALSEGYYMDPENKGMLATSQETFNNSVLEALDKGYQIATHGNGDYGIDSIIQGYANGLSTYPKQNHRLRIEHCQITREEQIDAMKELGIIASFFSSHVHYFGDRHKDELLGHLRAQRINPMGSAYKKGIPFGMHNDAPITPTNPLMSIYAAVTRRTLSGDILGPSQRIPVIKALQAMTIDAAYLGFEENIKGSIEVGKLADFVVLSENPLQSDIEKLLDINVDMTIVGGDIVYKNY